MADISSTTHAARTIKTQSLESWIRSLKSLPFNLQLQILHHQVIFKTCYTTPPQVITKPLGHTIDNLRPYDVLVQVWSRPLIGPVLTIHLKKYSAAVITSVGLIYLLILSFFIIIIGVSAREVSGIEKHLTTGSLIRHCIPFSLPRLFPCVPS
ncbi:hypothetical protein PM082_016721 [Marasmius tenuissimus]|nr:hypothetical protein PM082_016721 [Marasmius tenuissimus]